MSLLNASPDVVMGQALRHGMTRPEPIHWQGPTLSGPAKVAVVLACLDVPEAAQAMQHFSNEDALRVAAMISSVHTLDRERVIQVLEEFRFLTQHEPQIAFDADAFLRGLIAKFSESPVGEGALRRQLEKRIPALEAIAHLSNEDLYEHLRQEHPQVAATLLALLEPRQAASVLACFEPDLRAELLMRIALLNRVDPAVLSDLSDLLLKSIQNEKGTASAALGGVVNVADILAHFPTGAARDSLDQIRQVDPSLGEQIAKRMFVFEDFLRLQPEAIRRIMDEAPIELLVPALKASDPRLREHFLAHMSPRTQERVRFEMEISLPIQVQQVEAKHRDLIALARRLAAEGAIDLTQGSDTTHPHPGEV